MEKAKRIPVEEFFKNPEKSSYQISPNGNYVSYMAPWQDRMNIFIKEMDKDSATRITSVTDRDIAGYFWANDNRLVYLRDDGGNEDYYLLAVDRDGSNELALTKMEGVKTQIIDDLENIPDEMIIGLNKRIPQIFDPYRININSGEMEMVAENPGNIIGWMTDHDGKLRVAYTSDGVNQSLLYRETESDPFEVIMTNNFKETMEPLFFTFDNKNLYASSNIGRDKSALVVFDLATRQETDTIFQHDEVDVSGLSYSRKRKVFDNH